MENIDAVKMEESKRIEALATYLECDTEDLDKVEYRENAYEFGSEEYLILTDEEATKEAEEYIDQTLWAFRADFIIKHSALPWSAQEMVQSFQEDRCEEANETIRAIIDDDYGGFVSDAISSDGRGHFIAPYDFEENEVEVKADDWSEEEPYTEELYIYRVN